MSTVELRSRIDGFLNEVDENFLEVVHAMLETYLKQQMPEFSEKIEGVPSTDDEIMTSIEKGEQQLKGGDYYTIEELKAKTAQWFNTK